MHLVDEIGDISPAIQVKLLRTLEEKEIERVGDHQPIKVDVRVVSATNKNLEALIRQDLFRDDLYFRINVFPIHCPPLKDRLEDIPIIVRNFIRVNNEKSGKKILGMTPEAIESITTYAWPGNVRELRNAIDYAFVLCPSGGIGVDHLPPKIVMSPNDCVQHPLTAHQGIGSHATERQRTAGRAAEKYVNTAPELKPSDAAKRAALIDALRQTRGNRSETAKLLGVSRVTVWKQIKRYKIDILKDLST